MTVRNPYDRIRSAFVDKIPRGHIKLKDARNRTETKFVDFVEYAKLHPTQDIHRISVSKSRLTGSGNGKVGRKNNSALKSLAFKYDYVPRLWRTTTCRGSSRRYSDGRGSISRRGWRRSRRIDAPGAIADFCRDAAAEGGVAVEKLIATVGLIYNDDIDSFGYTFPSY